MDPQGAWAFPGVGSWDLVFARNGRDAICMGAHRT
ncbi:MAG: hypothetical protein A4E39_00239 [Methanoregulaceae archaeon PtaB.Bin152]|nr:MAG: hypothetical protein A4E39_00239 [Methanoregulaceae archaeon PtaB.Bin152]